MPIDPTAQTVSAPPAAPAVPRLLTQALDRLPARGERALIRDAQSGSQEAVEELFRTYWPIAFRAAGYITKDRAAAEDIAQEAFLAAIRKLDTFDRSRPFGPWFKRIVANRAIDWTRARQLRGHDADPAGLEALPDPGAEDRLDHAALPAGISEAVARLPLDQRTVIVLRHLLEYTPGEIAELLCVPRGTVNSRLRRGLDVLRAELEAR